jgi:hypothetical protein
MWLYALYTVNANIVLGNGDLNFIIASVGFVGMMVTPPLLLIEAKHPLEQKQSVKRRKKTWVC